MRKANEGQEPATDAIGGRAAAHYTELTEFGYTVFERVLSEELLSRLRSTTGALCADRSPEELARRRAQGTMMGIMSDPVFAELIAWPPALQRLAAMGFEAPTFTDGYIISKPPHSPRLFWHYDWFAWRDPGAFDLRPQQVFFMYYLTDTTVANGCLRVLPGSHRNHHPLRDLIGNPHGEKLSRALDLDAPAFSTQPDEVDVPVRAGDLVVGDARMLHAAHANASDERRTVIALWFQPDFASLPDRVKAQMVRKTQPTPAHWPVAAREMIRALNPHYDGNAEPYGRDLYVHRGVLEQRRT